MTGALRLQLHRFATAALAVAATLACAWVPSRAEAKRSYAPIQGYTFDVAAEREQVFNELPLAFMPQEPANALQTKIFNDQLTKEFRERYQQRFGYTDAQQAYNSPNKYTYYSDLYGFRGTPEQNNDARREFGEYMMRRLAEWHVDNYAKSDPQARVVWEAKERLSNVKLEVETFKFDARYSFSGNTFDLMCNNPYADAKVTMQLGGGGLGGETILTLSRPVTKTSSVESHWAMTDGIAAFIARKSLTSTLGTSFTASTFTKPFGTSVRESLYLGGLTYLF